MMERCRNQEEKELLAAHVGFLTSTTGCGLTTAIIVSKLDGLVYLCHSDPHARVDGLALGYRVRNSMFGRQLLNLWSYRLTPGQNTKLRDLPALLNSEGDFRDTHGNLFDPGDEGVFCNGFRAAFVGATTADGGRVMMGDCPLSDFLPLAPLDPDAAVPDCHGATFGQFIPPEGVGQLDDDIRKYRVKGDSSGTQFQELFVEITVGKGLSRWSTPRRVESA
jgi:hypothetical protein